MFWNQAIDHLKTALADEALRMLGKCDIPDDARLRFNIRRIWAFLLEKNWQQAGEAMYEYPLKSLNKGSTSLRFRYGCWLQATEGKEMAMILFTGLFHVPFPRTWALASHHLLGDLRSMAWFDKAFLWEKGSFTASSPFIITVQAMKSNPSLIAKIIGAIYLG